MCAVQADTQSQSGSDYYQTHNQRVGKDGEADGASRHAVVTVSYTRLRVSFVCQSFVVVPYWCEAN